MFVTLACRACDVASITVPYLYIQNRSGSCPRPLLTWTIEDKSYIMCVLWTKIRNCIFECLSPVMGNACKQSQRLHVKT